MTTKEIVREMIKEEAKGGVDSRLTKSLAVLSHRPFNMKGQEIEEIVGLLLHQFLNRMLRIDNSHVEVPQNKRAADIIFKINEVVSSFDIKSYGGAERFQLSTLKTILQDIRDKFNGSESRELDEADKTWLINKIKEEHLEYNLSFLSFVRKDGTVDVQVFDFDSLQIDMFKDKEFNLKITGKEKRVEIYIKITNNSTLEISAGGNPLNRGMWINKIKNHQDMELVYETEFITKLHSEKVILENFDKNKFIFEKAKLTIDLISQQFQIK
jgi:hypothetical protein